MKLKEIIKDQLNSGQESEQNNLYDNDEEQKFVLLFLILFIN